MKLDYSAFNSPLDVQEYNAYFKKSAGKNIVVLVAGIFIFSLFFLAPAAMYITFAAGSKGVLIMAIVLACVYAGVFVVVRRHMYKTDQAKFRSLKFAKNNSLYASFEGSTDQQINSLTESDLPLSLKGAVHMVAKKDNRKQTIGNKHFAVYSYSYTTGSGKNRKDNDWSVSAYRLNRSLPHILLDSKQNNFWKFTNLPKSIDQSQLVSLGGQADQYFDLYSPEGYNVDSLSYITPEVIELLINKFSNLDIEIIDDYLYIYEDKKFDYKQVEEQIKRLILFAEEIEDNTRSYRDTKAATANVSGAARQQISTQGKRLKTTFSKMTILSTVYGVFMMMFIFYRGGFTGGGPTMALVLIPFIVLSVITAIKSNRR